MSLRLAKASTMSKYKGSPLAPVSLVRSSTQIRSTVLGSILFKYFTEKGRYKCTETTPTFLPSFVNLSTTVLMVSVIEPIATTI